jgi:hypothetical protein
MQCEGRHVWIALVVVCLFAAIGGFVYSGASGRPNAKLSGIERQSALHAADDLLVTSASTAYERGLALTALSATEPIGPTESAAITERRVLVDGAITRTQMHLVHLMHLAPSAAREKIMDRIAVAYAKLLSQREEFDREARKPRSQREVNASLRSFDMPTALISAMQELLRAVHVELKTSDQGMAGWLEVQGLSQEMAEYAGRERAQIAAYLAAGARGTSEQLRGADYNRHQVVYAWSLLQSALTNLDAQRHIVEQANVVEGRYFADHDPVRQMLLAVNQPAGGLPMTAAAWFKHASLAIDAMINLGRDAGTLAAGT